MRAVRIIVSACWIVLVAVLALCAVGELGVRAVYSYALRRTERFPVLYETVYWNVPPWISYMSILSADKDVGLWMRPNVRRSYINLFGPIGDLRDVENLFTRLFPTIPAWASHREVWHLRTNSLAIRNDEINPDKPDGTFRVVLLGDSWTVGVNVEEGSTYAQQLAMRLRRDVPDVTFEVINYGAIGATSEVGRRLLPRIVALHPDVLVLAYAQNDEERVRKGPPGPEPPAADASSAATNLGTVWTRALGSLEAYKLLVDLRTRRPGDVEGAVKNGIKRVPGPADNEPRRECPAGGNDGGQYRQRLDAIVQAAAERGTEVVLLYNNVPETWSNCTLTELRRLARDRRLALVDASGLLARQGQAMQADLERTRGLVPPPVERREPATSASVVFRVDMSSESPGTRPFIMGNGPTLADFNPNQLELYDDGTHGDQFADDNVWSRTFEFSKPGRIIYLYTDGERPGEWSGLENYRARALAVRPSDMGTTVYAPVAQFGRRVLRSDPAHTDADGYGLIADALLDVIERSAALRAFRDSRARQHP